MRIALVVLLLISAAFLISEYLAFPDDVLLLFPAALYLLTSLRILLKPTHAAYIFTAFVGVIGAALVVIGGALAWMGQEIGSPGSGNALGVVPYVLMQLGIAAMAGLLAASHNKHRV
jgi:hypothetical protein